MNSIMSILGHIEQFRPGYKTQISGVTPEELSQLAGLAERPLPAEYAEFMLHMGRDQADLTRCMVGLDLSFSCLLRHYKESGWRAPLPYLLIGRDPSCAPIDSFLDCSSQAPKVVQFAVPGGCPPLWPGARVIADSLGELVFRCAFTNFLSYRYSYEAYATLEPQPGDLSRVHAVLSTWLQRHPLSGGCSWFYTGTGITAKCLQATPDDTVLLYLHADSPAAFIPIVKALCGVSALEFHHLDAKTAECHPGAAVGIANVAG